MYKIGFDNQYDSSHHTVSTLNHTPVTHQHQHTLMSSSSGKPTTTTAIRTSMPELKTLMDRQLQIQLNAKRTVVGTLRGYDAFMNIVLDDAYEHYTTPSVVMDKTDANEKPTRASQPIGMVVIRGNSVSSMQVL